MSATIHSRRHILMAGLLLGYLPGCGSQLVDFPSPTGGPNAPQVISTTPASSATDAVLTNPISATFSEAMRPSTIGPATFKLSVAGAPVSGTVTYVNGFNTATFTPDAAFAVDATYTATVTTGVTNTQGQAMEADYVWSFTFGNIEVGVASATAQSVPAPDYLLAFNGFVILTDANNIVISAAGEVELTAGQVTGQQYVMADGGGLATYAAIDGAYLSGTNAALITQVAAGDFALVGADLTTPQLRTLIIANMVSGVRSYQTFAVTFNQAP